MSTRPPIATGLLALLVALGAAALPGCSSNVQSYAYSRAFDLMDTVPISFAQGFGVTAEARVTQFVGVGIGYAETWRYGFDEQRFGPLWQETERAVPLAVYQRHAVEDEFTNRWAGRYRGSDLSVASSLVFLPAQADDGSLWPPFRDDAEWEWTAVSPWDALNVEAGVVVLFLGVRAAVSPGQLVDFVAGVFGADPADDDVIVDAEGQLEERDPTQGDDHESA